MAPLFGCASDFSAALVHLFIYFISLFSVIVIILPDTVALPLIYDHQALLTIKSAIDILQTQRNGLVFLPPLERGVEFGVTPLLSAISLLTPRKPRRRKRGKRAGHRVLLRRLWGGRGAAVGMSKIG